MAQFEASQIAMEEHAQTNEELRKTNEKLQKSLHRHGRRSTRECSPNFSTRDDPKPFSQQIMDEPVPAVPTRSSGVMTCLARDYVGCAQRNTWARER